MGFHMDRLRFPSEAMRFVKDHFSDVTEKQLLPDLGSEQLNESLQLSQSETSWINEISSDGG